MQVDTTSCQALRKINPSQTFLPHVKIGWVNSFLLRETGVPWFSRLVAVFTSLRVFAPQIICFSSYLMPLVVIHLSFYLWLYFSDSWGLIYNIEEELLLQVQTALVNACSCKDLLTSTSLVESHLVDVAPRWITRSSAPWQENVIGVWVTLAMPPPHRRKAMSPWPGHLPQLCLLLQLERLEVKTPVRRVPRVPPLLWIELHHLRPRTRAITWAYTRGSTPK